MWRSMAPRVRFTPALEAALYTLRMLRADSMARPAVAISFWSRALRDLSGPKPVPEDLNFITFTAPCRRKQAAATSKLKEKRLEAGPCTRDQAACSYAFRKTHRLI